MSTAPAVLIRIELEASPEVLVQDAGPGDHDRLLAWLVQHPRLLSIVGEAQELQGEAEPLADGQ
jgi:hypothetical protein